MIALTLNLLPPPKRKRLINLVNFLLTKEFVELTIFAASLLAIVFVSGWLVLVDSMGNLAKSSFLVSRQTPTINQDVRRLNKLFSNLITSGKEYGALSPVLLSIAQTLPPGIKLNSLAIDRAGKTVTIDGEAMTRDGLLAYENVLRTMPFLNSISHPTSLLFQKENVSFEIQASLSGFPDIPRPSSTQTGAGTD